MLFDKEQIEAGTRWHHAIEGMLAEWAQAGLTQRSVVPASQRRGIEMAPKLASEHEIVIAREARSVPELRVRLVK